ncbi:MAG: ferrous iron transport protein A [Deltaproteobacteria bacterium]|nr:ferrous iron transport protein A [Deltaproteobacteria bacterium]
MRLTEVEPETKVTVEKIEAGSEAKNYLKDLGIEEGTTLTVMTTEPSRVKTGPISIKIGGKDVVLGLGWADKIYIEKDNNILPVLELEKGEKGTVSRIECGKFLKDWFSQIGIEEKKEIEFLGHLPDDTLVFDVDDNEIKLGEGQASKFLVEYENETIQVNSLKEGNGGKISKIFSGTKFTEKLKNIMQGKTITLVRRETSAPAPIKGNYVVAKIGEQLITIGKGLAEKIQVTYF